MGQILYDTLLAEDGRESIRILELLPGDAGELIRCNLKPVYLLDGPRYEAISYCWGDQTSKRRIVCNDADLDIGINIYNCLYRLRSTKKSRTLWADAICINQKGNGEEKGRQVSIMRQIYQQATRVIVWLGEESQASSVGMALIPVLVQAHQNMEKAGEKRDYPQIGERERKRYGIPNYTSKRLKAFLELTSRSWFHRVWVIQEITASSDAMVVCGGSHSPWKEFTLAIQCVSHLRYSVMPFVEIPFGLSQLESIIDAQSKFSAGVREDLVITLNRYRDFLATDPRDKIFALLKLSGDSAARALQVETNYQKTVAETYLDFAVRIIRTSEHLDILSVPQEISKGIELPSWVPNWATGSDCSPLIGVSTPRASKFRVSGSSVTAAVFSEDRRALGLLGYVVDSITKVGPGMDFLTIGNESRLAVSHRVHCTFIDWENISQAHSGQTYVNGEPILDAYWQTLICGHSNFDFKTTKQMFNEWSGNGTKSVPLVGTIARTIRSEWVQKTTRSMLGWSRLLQIGNTNSTMKFSSAYSDVVADRAIFVTDKGYMGLCPRQTRVADKVVLVKGGRTPLILRSKEARWELIGDCYMHGAMHGELYDEKVCDLMWID